MTPRVDPPLTADNSWLGCLGVLVALVGGGITGGIVALLLGLPIARALDISDFEGASGYFVAFVMLPGGCLLGAATALFLYFAFRRRRLRRARTAPDKPPPPN